MERSTSRIRSIHVRVDLELNSVSWETGVRDEPWHYKAQHQQHKLLLRMTFPLKYYLTVRTTSHSDRGEIRALGQNCELIPCSVTDLLRAKAPVRK